MYKFADGTSRFDMTDSHTVRVEGDKSITVDMRAIPTHARVVAHRYQYAKRYINTADDSPDSAADDDEVIDADARAFLYTRPKEAAAAAATEQQGVAPTRAVATNAEAFPTTLSAQLQLASENLSLLAALEPTDDMRLEVLQTLIVLRPLLESALTSDDVLADEALCARLLDTIDKM